MLAALHQLEKARSVETEALAIDVIRSMTTGLVSLDPSGIQWCWSIRRRSASSTSKRQRC